MTVIFTAGPDYLNWPTGRKLRKILLNSWEGVYFKINETGMSQMMSDIASLGGELFVMDDGWFGDKYPRRTDRSFLGGAGWFINQLWGID